MDELLEGILAFGEQTGEFVVKIEDLTSSLKNHAAILDSLLTAFTEPAVADGLLQSAQNDPQKITRVLAERMKQRETEEWSFSELRRFRESAAENEWQAIDVMRISMAHTFAVTMSEGLARPSRDAIGPLRDSLIPAVFFTAPFSKSQSENNSSSATGEANPNEDASATRHLDKMDQRGYRPEFTSLEKMGFIMSGSKVQNPYEQRQVDLLQQIAENTRQRPYPSMPGDKHLRDIIDPAPFISNIV